MQEEHNIDPTGNAKKYRKIFENIDEGFAIVELEFDPNGKIADMVYRQTNDAFERITGISNAVGKKVSVLYPNLERVFFDVLSEVAKTGLPLRIEEYVSDLDRWYDVIYSRDGAQGSPFIIGVFKDITQRKRRELKQLLVAEITKELVSIENIEATRQLLCEKIATHFDTSWCRFTQITGESLSIVSHGWNAPDMPAIDSIYQIQDFRPYLQGNREQPTVINDVHYDSLPIRAFILAPASNSESFKFSLDLFDSKPTTGVQMKSNCLPN